MEIEMEKQSENNGNDYDTDDMEHKDTKLLILKVESAEIYNDFRNNNNDT